MFIRLLTILMLLTQQLSLAAVIVDSDCEPAFESMVMDEHGGCCCGDMAASCLASEVMSCGCFENNDQNTPAPATPRNQNSQVIASAVLMPASIILDSTYATHPVMPGRSIGFFRSNTHKQATLCVWLS